MDNETIIPVKILEKGKLKIDVKPFCKADCDEFKKKMKKFILKTENIKKQRYKCPEPECGHICTEDEMLGDCSYGGGWSNWICPKCRTWQISLKDWIKIKKKKNEQ